MPPRLLAAALHLISIVALVCIGVLAIGRPRWWLGRWIARNVPALAVANGLALAGQWSAIRSRGSRHPAGCPALRSDGGVSAHPAASWDALGLIVLVVPADALLAVGSVGAGCVCESDASSACSVRRRASLGAPAVPSRSPPCPTPALTARYLSWVATRSGAHRRRRRFHRELFERAGLPPGGVCAVILLAGARVTAQQLAEPPGLYDDAPSLVRELDAGAEVGGRRARGHPASRIPAWPTRSRGISDPTRHVGRGGGPTGFGSPLSPSSRYGPSRARVRSRWRVLRRPGVVTTKC